VLAVDWYSVRTDRRTITREETRAAVRPVTHRNDTTWEIQFPSRATLEAGEVEEQKSEGISRGRALYWTATAASKRPIRLMMPMMMPIRLSRTAKNCRGPIMLKRLPASRLTISKV
jgi:hypothetical protein